VSSGDGTLSVMDVRSKKPEPFAHSEDQEDELLSIVPFKG
jgi:WD repeat-containing protein 55